MISSTPRERAQLLLDVVGRVFIGDRHQRRQELPDLPDEQILVGSARGQTDDLEPIGVAPDHVERLRADEPVEPRMARDFIVSSVPRAGAEPASGCYAKMTRNSRNVAGATNSNESMRSSTPPWPGRMLPCP